MCTGPCSLYQKTLKGCSPRIIFANYTFTPSAWPRATSHHLRLQPKWTANSFSKTAIRTANQSWSEVLDPLLGDRNKISSILQDLNDEQRRAVLDTSRVVRVAAGPGSGKTRVITTRVAVLLSNNVPPENIVVLTFTNKAARELRERLVEFLPSTLDSKQMWIGTFHGLANRILRRHVDRLGVGLTRDFVIYDEEDAKHAMVDALGETVDIANIPKDASPEEKRLAQKARKAALAAMRTKVSQCAGWCSHVKELVPCYLGKSSHELYQAYWDRVEELGKTRTSGNGKIKEPSLDFFRDIFGAYVRAMKESNAVDFGDLLSLCNALFRSTPTLSEYRHKFHHILVDEFQDTNLPQYEFLRLLTLARSPAAKYQNTPSLFVVGDPNQAIYEFRGSDVSSMAKRIEEDYGPELSSHVLLQNYRNQACIIKGAQQLLKTHGNPNLHKAYVPVRIGTGELRIGAFRTDKEEARFAAQLIQNLYNDGISYQEIGVLFRTQVMSRCIEQECSSLGIPFSSPQGFWTRAEVKDILCYLRVIHNPHDSMGFDRIINTPKRGIGPAAVKAISTWAEGDPQGIGYPGILLQDLVGVSMSRSDCAEVFGLLKEGLDLSGAMDRVSHVEIPSLPSRKSMAISTAVWNSLSLFRKMFVFVRSTAKYFNVERVIESVLLSTNYEEHLDKKTPEKSDSKLVNIRSMGAPYRYLTGLSGLAEFVQNGILWSEENRGATDKVWLGTMHSAKGLEFQVVFLLGLEDGTMPLVRDQECNIEEETRLMYVAMTRAKDKLFLSHAKQRGYLWERFPSRYIDELLRTH